MFKFSFILDFSYSMQILLFFFFFPPKQHSLSCKISFSAVTLFVAHAVTTLCVHWKWGVVTRGWAGQKLKWHNRVPVSPLPKLALPLCWSISLHDDRRRISHIRASFPHWLWQGQTLEWWKFNESVKEGKAQHLHEQGPKVTPHGLVFWYRCCWVSFFLGGGAGQGDGTGCFKQPGVVGRNVLSFSFQSKVFWGFFFFPQLTFKVSLKNVPFFVPLYPSECTKSHKTVQGKKGQACDSSK